MNEIIRNIPDWLIPVLILLISIIAVAVIFDRIRLLIFKTGSISLKAERELLDLVRTGKLDEALEICQKQARKHPGFAVSVTLIESAKMGLNFRATLESEAHRTTKLLKKFLPTLGTIATIAPLMGLLGTVTGMIKSFHAFDNNKVQNAQLVGGIDEALITTTLGLIVGIPSLIVYNYLVNRVNLIAEETFILSDQIVEELDSHAKQVQPITEGVQNG
ncbi:MAG: MotA/TolQ/ExbB proton channel family protein [Spirochaetota bacterium]